MSLRLEGVSLFLEKSAEVASIGDLDALLADTISRLGFQYYSYVTARVLGEDATRTENPIVIGNYDPAWLEHYTSNSYQYVDAVLAAGTRTRSAYVWGGDRFIRTQSGDYRKMMLELREFGVLRGLTVPVHGYAGESGFLSVSVGEREKCFQKLVKRNHHQISMISQLTQDIAIEKFVRRAEKPKIKLSSREIECLLWAADGKTADETAKILGCRERTVRFHLGNAAEKLGTSGKLSTIVRAQKMRLL